MKKKLLLLAVPLGLYLIFGTSYSFFLDVPFNAKRLVEGIFLVTSAGMICASTYFQETWVNILVELKNRSRVLIWALAAWLFIGLLSATLSNYPQFAFLEVSHFFLLFNLIILSVIGFLNKPSLFEEGFLCVIGLMTGLYLVNVAISYSYTFFVPDFPIWPGVDFTRIYFEGIGFKYPEPFRNFINIRLFNHMQTWSLPLLTLLVLQIPKKFWAFQKIALIIACGWWMLAFASDARGTLVASFLALVFIFVFYRKKAKQWLQTHSLAAVIGAVLYGIFFKLVDIFNTSGGGGGRTAFSDFSAESRFEIWDYALSITLENPIFGVGPMHFNQIGSEITKNAHNIYLQFFSEWGIPAGILFLALVVLSSYKWFKSTNGVIDTSPPNSKKTNTRVALTASLLAALIHGLVSNIFNTPVSQILMVMIVAWMIGLSLRNRSEKEPQLRQNIAGQEKISLYARFGLIGLHLVAAGFLIWSYSVQVPNLDENRQKYIQITNENRLTPRYWDQEVVGLEKHSEELNKKSTSE